MQKEIYSIIGESSFSQEIKKSRFIGNSFRCGDEKEAFASLSLLKKQHPGATHHCWAYVYGLSGEHSRYNDDGEPHGTAGPPILEVIKKKNLTGVCIVVTRYYGGTKLGASGLIRAYSDTAARTIDVSGIKVMRLTKTLRCTLSYTILTPFEKLLESISASEVSREFAEDVTIVIRIPSAGHAEFMDKYMDLTAGRALAVETGEDYR